MKTLADTPPRENRGAAASQKRRVWRLSVALATVLVIALYGVVLLNQIVGQRGDYPIHIEWVGNLDAGQFHVGGVKIDETYLPHYLFQALGYTLALLPGLDAVWSAFAVSLLANVAVALIIHAWLYWALPEPGRYWIGLVVALLALTLLLVGPLSFFTWHRSNYYLGYIAPNVYHNPTMTLLRPFALLLFLCAVKGLEFTPADRRPRMVLITVVLTVLATMAKPSYTICLLPVMGGLLALQWLRRKPVNWALIVGGILVPGLVMLGLQYLFTFGTSENRIIFSPLTVVRYFESVHIFPKLALSLVFPVLVIALFLRRARRDTPLNLAWLVLAPALAYAYLLSESQNATHGNFFWSAHIALFILFVVTVRFLMQQVLIHDQVRLTWRTALSAGILALHLVAGVAWYLTEVLAQPPRW